MASDTTLFTRIMSWAKNIFWILLLLNLAPSLLMSLKKKFSVSMESKTYVASMNLKGMIIDSSSFVKNLHRFLKNPEVKALLLRIDCGGGAAASSQVMFNEIKKFNEKKPVVALIENMCASGAYYAAAPATCIIAIPSSIIGSIGGFIQLPNFKELADTLKIKVDFVQAGKYKTILNPLKDRNPEDLAYIQPLVDDTYQQFVNDVAACRKLSAQDHETWADGRVFSGERAIKIGLVDKLGSLSEALDELKTITKTDGEIRFVYPTQPSALERLTYSVENDEGDSEGASLSNHLASSMLGTFLGLFKKI